MLEFAARTDSAGTAGEPNQAPKMSSIDVRPHLRFALIGLCVLTVPCCAENDGVWDPLLWCRQSAGAPHTARSLLMPCDQVIELFRPLTIIVGHNGAGKTVSAIYHALLLNAAFLSMAGGRVLSRRSSLLQQDCCRRTAGKAKCL